MQSLCLISAVCFARKDFLPSATHSGQNQLTSHLFLDFFLNSWICVCGYNTKNWQEWKQVPLTVAKSSSLSLKSAIKKCGCDEIFSRFINSLREDGTCL